MIWDDWNSFIKNVGKILKYSQDLGNFMDYLSFQLYRHRSQYHTRHSKSIPLYGYIQIF